MAIPKKIKNFLEKLKLKYEIINHKTVFTAFDKAQTLKLPTRIIGKTLILKGDKNLFLALIPADKNLDLKKFKKILKVKKVDFLSEKIIKQKFKGVKVGAIPPFGFLWKIKTLIDKSLMKEKKIIINCGNYTSSLKIAPNYLKKIISDLKIGSFSKTKK